MAGALERFFKKINFTDTVPFEKTDVEKVVVHQLESTWDIHIKNKMPVDIESLENLRNIAKKGFDDCKSVDFIITNELFADQDVLSYIKYYLEQLSVKSPSLKSLKGNDIIVNDKNIKIEVTNPVEESLIKTKSDKIIAWLVNMGMPGCTIETYTNEIKRKRVRAEIEDAKSQSEDIPQPSVAYEERKGSPVLEVKEPALFGVSFNADKVTPIRDITDEKRGVVIVASIIDIRAIESSRSDYKIFTIKVEDETDEFTCKLFTTDVNVYRFLLKNLKEGKWYKFRGTVQNDSYLKSLVLTIRSIMECDEDEAKAKKKAIEPEADYGFMDDSYYIPGDDDYGEMSDSTIDAAFFAFDDDLPETPNFDLKEDANSPVDLQNSMPLSFQETTIKSEVAEEQSRRVEAMKERILTPRVDDAGNRVILGNGIKGLVQQMRNVAAPVNSAIFEARIFAVELFESSKNNFKIITLKLTDDTDSFLAKIFTKDASEYKARIKDLKVGKWIRIEGQIKYDDYAKDLVMTPRNVVEIPSRDIRLIDDAPIKRVELHSHTMMSQMDGVLNVNTYLDELHRMGYKAVAITDHHGAQSFPEAFRKVNSFNKGIEKDEDKFKVLYGAELVMIEDTVDIVKRPVDLPSLDATYCVFDFETTGFNAGGGDTIIEIGAVLIKSGEIIAKYDELINPGRPLPSKITEITNITDEMLKDKDNEENAVRRFIEFFKDYPMVAHNAKFDCSFLEMAYKKYGLGEFTNCVIDTLELSRALDTGFSRHSLSALVKRYNVEWDENAHHRGDYDAEGTAKVLDKMVKKMYNQNIENIKDFNNLVDKNEIYKFGRSFHINILVKNKTGLKNLFKLISLANTKYLYKTPRILRSEVETHREGLLIGSGCYESEVFKEAKRRSDEELSNIISFYDYVEVQPPEVYDHLIQLGEFVNVIDIQNHIKKIVEATENSGVIIVATGDVHHLRREDKISREIIINQKVPGGGRHPLAKSEITNIPSQHFRTTEEMLKDFAFLDSNTAERIVIDNTNRIADMCEFVEVIINTGGVPFAPKIENSEQIVKDLVYNKAHSIYGDPLPSLIEERIASELKGIIKGGYDVIYLIAQKLVKHSNDEGYLVGSRGSVGSSFVATMMGITEVNPLPAHYVCPKCKHTDFEVDGKDLSVDYSCGYDMPDRMCPQCGNKMNKEGHDMPFATFLGFNADKVPDIDLNFSGDNQASAHEYTKVLFGVDNVYRAGTVGTVADKTAYGFVRGYCEAKGITDMKSVEMERLAMGCTGVKRTTGQHPGGIVVIPDYMDVFDFTPFQYPADDPTSAWRTTHFEYHALEEDILKLDILGHDDPTVLRMLEDLSGLDVTKIPLDDKDTMAIYQGPEILGVKREDIECETGTLGVPEFGTRFVVKMLSETKPKTFAELVKISGLSHGTDVWTGNARDLIMSHTVEFKDVIGCRDDIMVNLIAYGMEPLKAFKIMEFVRKGKAGKDPETWASFTEDMKKSDVPTWYINTCGKIKYMFPKAHAVAYVTSAFRIAWFKVHKPLYYYAAYYSIRCNDFDIETMCAGYDAIKKKFDSISDKGFDAGVKESALADELQLAMEMYKRGIKFKMIDLEKSHAKYFIIDETENALIFPFRGLDGLGENVANLIVSEREKAPFLSIEDVQIRAKVNSTTIDKMRTLHIFDGLSESNQLSLFD